MTLRRFVRLVQLNQIFFTVLTSILFLIHVYTIGTPADFIEYTYIGIVFSRYAITGYVKSFEFALSVTLIALFLVPTTLSVAMSDGEYVEFLAFAQLFTSALLAFSNRINGIAQRKDRLNDRFRIKSWLALLTLIVIGWHMKFDTNSFFIILIFFVPFAASLVIVARSVNRLSLLNLYGVIFVYFAITLYYAVFLWSGFGRLIIVAYMLMPLLLINHHRDIGLRVWHLVVIIPLSLLGAFLLRFRDNDFARILEDSWSSHLTLTAEMADTLFTRKPPGFGEYFNQYLLLIFQWVPRDLWPSKPIGIGLSFVDDWIGRGGFDAGHSIALGFIGETMWYLGPWYLVGIATIFLTLTALRFIAFRLDRDSYVLLAIFDSFLPSFFWGGMATYGSRFWFFFFPALMTLILLKIRLRLDPSSAPRVHAK